MTNTTGIPSYVTHMYTLTAAPLGPARDKAVLCDAIVWARNLHHYYRVQSVDSISRDGPDMPICCIT